MDSEKGPKPEQRELKELDFEAGVQAALAKIDEVLEDKDMAFVAIYGSQINVGKTTLLGKLSTTLKERGIGTAAVSTMELASRHPPYFSEHYESPKRVLFFESEGMPFPRMDVAIYITRPGVRSFTAPELQFADVLINNTAAKDK